MAQYFCQVLPVLEVPRPFKPAPKVESAVVRLIPHKKLPYPVKDLYWLNHCATPKPLTSVVKLYVMLYQPYFRRKN